MNLTESLSVKLLLGNGTHVELALDLYEIEDDFRIALRCESMSGGEVSGDGESLFDALCALRIKLEAEGRLIQCAGACCNVYPSPMSRSMGDGRKAYRLTLGKQAMTADLVDIFDPEEGCTLCTVEKQEEFYKLWVKSLQESGEPTGS